MLSALIVFIGASGACGAAPSIRLLIAFRAIQGIGAAGCVSIGLTIAYEMLAAHDYPKYTAIVSALSAIGSLLGPIIGGAFSDHATWRWVFLINVPIGVIIVPLLYFSIPNGFPFQNSLDFDPHADIEPTLIGPLKHLDLLGAYFLLAASLLLVNALLGAGTTFPWNSPTTIALFISAGFLLLAFLVQEHRLSTRKTVLREPIFPWSFFKNRAWMSMLL